VLLAGDDLEKVVQQPRGEDLHLWLLLATLGEDLLLALANLGQFVAVRADWSASHRQLNSTVTWNGLVCSL
jgi:hypothetical protein